MLASKKPRPASEAGQRFERKELNLIGPDFQPADPKYNHFDDQCNKFLNHAIRVVNVGWVVP
jgi:hypothetical protein